MMADCSLVVSQSPNIKARARRRKRWVDRSSFACTASVQIVLESSVGRISFDVFVYNLTAMATTSCKRIFPKWKEGAAVNE